MQEYAAHIEIIYLGKNVKFPMKPMYSGNRKKISRSHLYSGVHIVHPVIPEGVCTEWWAGH